MAKTVVVLAAVASVIQVMVSVQVSVSAAAGPAGPGGAGWRVTHFVTVCAHCTWGPLRTSDISRQVTCREKLQPIY